MMKKKTSYTSITPIPSFIPRQLAVDMLQSHGEIIELNPLVTGYEAIKAPRDAPADEFYATWYSIRQKIQYVPGIGKLGSGSIKFNGCFHDMPWGLQTHTYAPAGVDLRNKWQICGNQPGEPAVPQELGLGAPPEGLYLREDIEIRCNVAVISFVKKETQAASKKMVERLIKKAELLDSGVLQGMMENGKLKTHNPADRRSGNHVPPRPSSTQPYQMPMSPQPSPKLFGTNTVAMELPGDYYHPQTSPGLLHPNDSTNDPNNRASTASDSTTATGHSPNPQDGRWSQVSHSSASSCPSSYTPSEGMRSPGLEQKAFTAELPTMDETREEHESRRQSEQNLGGGAAKYVYNPQDYVRTQAQFAAAPPYTTHGSGFVHGQGGYQPHMHRREGYQR